MIDLYYGARSAGLRPALLESAGPLGGLSLLGVSPTRRVEVRDGATWLDGERIGGPMEIFRVLETGLGTGFFPAWIGFASYELARHLGQPAGPSLPGLPDAVFHYYPKGIAVRSGETLESTEVPARSFELPPLPSLRPASDLPESAFLEGVERVQEQIRAGEVYQVNLSRRFHFPARGVDPLALYARLRSINPSPFMGLVEGDGWAIVSGSPERLFSRSPRGVDGTSTIRARPIAGTRPRGASPAEDEALEAELRSNPKERAEHVMLVDLLRNDLARVCEPGSVALSEAFTVERYSHVMHLVSEVEGRSRAGLGELFASIFPGGSITGAPKTRVMEAIAELEPAPRGSYTGCLGYSSGAGADFNILIRSFTVAGDEAYFSCGGGIVIDSDPARELAETDTKAASLLAALERGKEGRAPAPPRKDATWEPPRSRRPSDARVLFVENRDSFSFNVVDYLRASGAEVRVVDRDEAPELDWPTHVVVGPGPGEPATAGRTLEWIGASLEAGLPLLGVCLGHQALGVALGARLGRASRPVHGVAERVAHAGRGIFEALPSPASFARYHSLSLHELPPGVELEAWAEDGSCMAISARDRRAWGVQFHPESILSTHGMELLSAFLELRA
ncbi:chorismate-binding protein [Vulgatibacter incomptus]|uniref:Para-aminobenzoate synthase, aminase component n=1 Tax=Vulgatibacter incomptus TaxID=1391653 RepID=A0A0K1PAK6_9BACT|nr:chorismate-binding protein [Vulgatibacter incomptus]AKU90550.1 Para-aminobenzoate synthase, aminase component [Vulgatibacter incomptus]